jgi:hypothetical protein
MISNYFYSQSEKNGAFNRSGHFSWAKVCGLECERRMGPINPKGYERGRGAHNLYEYCSVVTQVYGHKL